MKRDKERFPDSILNYQPNTDDPPWVDPFWDSRLGIERGTKNPRARKVHKARLIRHRVGADYRNRKCR